MPAGALAAREHEPELHLHVGTGATVVDHRAVGADPDVTWHPSGAGALGMGTEQRLRAHRDISLDTATLFLDPGMELAMADRQTAQLVECPGRLGIAELGDEEEGPLPHPERVLHAGRQPEQLIERHEFGTTGPAAIATAPQLQLAREGSTMRRGARPLALTMPPQPMCPRPTTSDRSSVLMSSAHSCRATSARAALTARSSEPMSAPSGCSSRVSEMGMAIDSTTSPFVCWLSTPPAYRGARLTGGEPAQTSGCLRAPGSA